MSSMLWEFFVVGMLLYGLAFLGLAVWSRERKPAATLDAASNWGRAHPRIMTPLRTSTNWATGPRRRSRSTACGSPNRAIRTTGPVRAARRVPKRRRP
jgi:hypothetical protein